MSLQTVHVCPVCERSDFIDFHQSRDYSISGENFTIKQCRHCSLLLTNPRPDATSIGRYYQSENYISHSGKNQLFDNVYRLARQYSIRRKYKLIRSMQPTGTILDIGCGTGEFLNYFKQKKWNVHGVEPNETARVAAIKLINQSIEREITSVNTRADVITLWHVLEHVPEPNETLQSIYSLLAVSGLLLIAVPNYLSYDAKHYQSQWAGYDLPRHLWHFNKISMTQLLTKHGFKIAKIHPMKLDAYYVSLLSESYLHPGRPKLIHAMNAFISGLTSNLSASGSGEFSSLIYLATKA